MLSKLLKDLRSTSKPSGKVEVMKKHDCEFLRYLVHATYEPFVMYHIKLKKSEIPKPGKGIIENFEENVRNLLEFCKNSMSNKQNRAEAINLLMELNEGSQELLVGVLEKNWKAGLGTKSVRKIFPGLVSSFEVQLANTYKKDKKYVIHEWLWSYKLDGVRCVALRMNDEWVMYTRKGKEFLTLNHLKPQLERLYKNFGYTFWDGELYKHGLSFEEIQSQVMAFTKGTAREIEYHVFVAGKAEDFLSARSSDMDVMTFGPPESYAPDVHIVTQPYITPDKIDEVLEYAFSQGYEGIMLRNPGIPYDFKRSDAIVKLKEREGEGEIISDARVVDIKIDDFPVIENEVMRYEKLLVRLEVEQEDGKVCGLGSGFNLDFRRHYTKHPDELLGKIVEIKHQQWGANGLMRFPRLHRVREDL